MNIQSYKDLFECQETEERGQWWSFKLDAIKSENKKYRALSDVIQNATVDQDSAYKFTVEALDAIKEMKENKVNLSEPWDELSSYPIAPVYNSQLIDWLNKSSNYTFVDDAVDEFGWQKDGGLILMIQYAYSKAWEEHYFKVLEVVKA